MHTSSLRNMFCLAAAGGDAGIVAGRQFRSGHALCPGRGLAQRGQRAAHFRGFSC